MNYSYLRVGVRTGEDTPRLDYSRTKFPDLDENQLEEAAGILLPTGISGPLFSMHYCAAAGRFQPTHRAEDGVD